MRSGILYAALLWTILVTLARGIREPNDFAAAHWLIDYRFGFIRRGLAGTLVSLFCGITGLEASYGLIVAVGALGLVAVTACFLWALSILLRRADWDLGTSIFCVIMAGSPMIVLTGHLLSYLDAVFILLLVAALAALHGNQYLLAAGIQIIAVLVHESYLLVGWPAVVAACYIWRKPPGRAWVAAAAPALVPLAVVALEPWSPDAKAALQHALTLRLTEAGYIVPFKAELVPRYLLMSFREVWSIESPRFFSRIFDFHRLILFGPVLAAMAVQARKLHREWWTILLAVTPLVIHAVAWDTTRIWGYTLITGFAIVVILALAPPAAARPVTLPPGWMVAGVFAIALAMNVKGHLPLMDSEVDRFDLVGRGILYLPAAILLGIAIWPSGGEERGSRIPTTRTPDLVPE